MPLCSHPPGSLDLHAQHEQNIFFQLKVLRAKLLHEVSECYSAEVRHFVCAGSIVFLQSWRRRRKIV